MSAFIGRLIQVGIGKETSRGIAVPPTFWLNKVNVTIDDKPVIVTDESTIGRIEDSIGGKIVLEGAEGEISGKVFDKSFGLFLLAALGSVSSNTKSGESGVYEHTFSVLNSAQHPSLTIECKNPNEQLAFALAMLDSLEIRAEIEKFVEYTATFKSKKGVSSSTTPSYTSENDFIPKHISVKMANSISGLDGASAIPVRSVTLKINKNLERDDTFGYTDPYDILNKQFGIELTIAMLHRNTTYKDFYRSGSKKAIRIDFVNNDVTIGNSSNPRLKINLAQVLFTNWEKTTGANDLVIETITGKATYSTSEASMITCVLTNTQSSY